MLLKYLILFPRMGYQIHLLKKYLPKYANCVFVSEGFLKQAQKQTRRKFPNAVVIANPVDMDLFTFQEPKFSPRGLSLRSFSTAIYGFDISIKAFQKTENAHLDIYGKGVLKSKYEQMSKSLGANVSIISKHLKHDDIPELYSQYSYFVTTTRADTQGLAMCEAMACGLPAIATNVGGIPDYVIDGYNGYLVEKDNPESARKAVEKLLSDENKYYEMSRNARKLMEEKCSSDVVVAKELDLLKQAIEKWEK
jgi:glycosyltransferase involved in cell wall biosynthesis